MVRKLGLPLLAIIGICFALFMIWKSSRTPPVAKILFKPATSPYPHYIAGTGTVEAFCQNIDIGVPFPEIVTDVYVQPGAYITKGTPLFKLDTQRLEARLEQAVQELHQARVNYDAARTDLAFYERLQEPSAVSEQAWSTAWYAAEKAHATTLVANAQINTIKTDIERSIIRAPGDGQVLQINTRPGQIANLNPFDQKPLMLFGYTHQKQVRIDVDEEDAWRIIPGAQATGFVRGNNALTIPLEFLHLEPYFNPKTALTGLSSEKVDTRVLNLVYACTQEPTPLYAGQVIDVFIAAQPHEGAT